MAAPGAWASPPGGAADDDGAEWAFPDANEAVTGAGVTLRLPAAALEDLPSLADVLSLRTCVAPATSPRAPGGTRCAAAAARGIDRPLSCVARRWREVLSESERDELRRLLPAGTREGPGQELEARPSRGAWCLAGGQTPPQAGF